RASTRGGHDLAPPAPGRQLRARGAARRPRAHEARPRRRARRGHHRAAVVAVRDPGHGRGARRAPHGVPRARRSGEPLVSFWEAYDFCRDSMAAVLLAGGMCPALRVYLVLRRVAFGGPGLTPIPDVTAAL